MEEVNSLLKRKQWDEARALLQDMDRQYKNHPAVLSELVNLAYDTKDMRAYQLYCERLAKVMPDDPDVQRGLAGAYLTNGYPWLALAEYQRLRARFAADKEGAKIDEVIALLEAELPLSAIGSNLSEAEQMEIMPLQDRGRAMLEGRDLRGGRQIIQKVLAMKPTFVPALNNLSQIEHKLGNTGRAIQLAQQVLEQEPDNVQALSNLSRYLFLSGDEEAAHRVVERLLPLASDEPVVPLKKLEALLYLDRNEDALAVARAVEQADGPIKYENEALFHHYRAAAAARTGDERLAQQAWKAALAANPHFRMAQENLADLALPSHERYGAWAIEPDTFLSQPAIDEFRQLAIGLHKEVSSVQERAVRRYLRRYPEVVTLLPILLERSGPIGRNIALTLLLYGGQPDLHALIPGFLAGDYGPDQLRLMIHDIAHQRGILPAGEVDVRIRGKLEKVQVLNFTIHDRPTGDLPPKAEDFYADAFEAQSNGDLATAERLYLRAREAAPDSPVILNNLARVYHDQGHTGKADAIIEELQERFPDYFFGIVAQINRATIAGDYDRAHELLRSLTSRPELHISEFRALATAYVQFLLRQDEDSGARRWLDMWEEMEPDHPDLLRLKARMDGPAFSSVLEKLVRGRKKGTSRRR
ncbi:MAG: tetratricopeptide repeat protein [Caldilineaceae bacterium]|nr:tetratricopeptide repeat protein [Caldilineaceae bacterium]